MDKNHRRKLIQKYKKKELEDNLNSESTVIANFAKLKLGLTSEPLTESRISTTPNNHLLELIHNKIEETSLRIYKENPKENKSQRNVLSNLPFHFQFIYHSQYFEMSLAIGDYEKIMANSPTEEIEIIAQGYSLLGFQTLANHIINAANGVEEVEFVENEFNVFGKSIENEKIKYIRNAASIFQLL